MQRLQSDLDLTVANIHQLFARRSICSDHYHTVLEYPHLDLFASILMNITRTKFMAQSSPIWMSLGSQSLDDRLHAALNPNHEIWTSPPNRTGQCQCPGLTIRFQGSEENYFLTAKLQYSCSSHTNAEKFFTRLRH
jgi:hypothetical protein